MTIYTQDPGQGINQPIGNAPSGLGESLAATFEQGFDEGPFNSALRLNRAYGQLNDPDSPVIPKAEADATLKQYGVKSINVPDEGVTKTYLDNVVSARKDALAKQQIAAAAPSGFVATPLNVMANLAGAMADPGNLALGLVPFAGEARAATLLGRAGDRFLQGAAMGGIQTGVTLPTTALASAAEGDDFTLGNAMENFVYGVVGGGLLHAGGGVIADLVRGRRADSAGESPLETTTRVEPVSDPVSPARTTISDPDNASPLLDQTISREADNYAYSRAYDDVIPDYQQSLQDLQQGRIDNVADLRAEMEANEHAASRLDATLKDRTEQYQNQRMKYRDARQRAMADIESEKQSLSSRNDEINQALDGNAAAEKAAGELSAIGRGEIPDGLADRISERAGQIKSGLQRTNLAEGVRTAAQRIDDAHWTQRQNAFRAGLSHMMQGKAPDVEPFFELNDSPSNKSRGGWLEANNRSMRELADRVGLTGEIENLFAQGKTAAQVVNELGSKLDFLASHERNGFIVSVRSSLGIPSRISAEGQSEFNDWLKSRGLTNSRSAGEVLGQIRKGPRSDAEPSTVNASRDADADYQRASRDDADLLNAQEDFEAEMNLAKQRVEDLDSPELREALSNIQKEANDESLVNGYQAYAACMLRRI